MARRTQVVVTVTVRAALLMLLWLLLVGNLQAPELITGGVVACVAAALASVLHPTQSIGMRPAMLHRIYRPLLLLVSDTVRVSGALLQAIVLRKPAQGRFCASPYRAVGGGAEQGARRALSEWAGSVGANRYVIGIDRDAGLILIHELVRASGPADPLELG